jgi:hypothetical protein
MKLSVRTTLISLLLAATACTNPTDTDDGGDDFSGPPANPYGSGNGMLMVWTSAAVPGPINVTLGGIPAGVITNYYSSGAPGCSAQGTVSVVLPAGNHRVQAASPAGITWDGTASVTEGQCNKFELRYSGNTQPNVPTTIGGRPVETLGTITVRRPNVVMCVWDHATIDGDIITLYVNGTVLFASYTLTGSKRCANVTLNALGYSYVALFAHNEGSIPPNTAALSINDGVSGDQTYELRASLSTNGAYNILVQP